MSDDEMADEDVPKTVAPGLQAFIVPFQVSGHGSCPDLDGPYPQVTKDDFSPTPDQSGVSEIDNFSVPMPSGRISPIGSEAGNCSLVPGTGFQVQVCMLICFPR